MELGGFPPSVGIQAPFAKIVQQKTAPGEVLNKNHGAGDR
jgi:hypothetical protein